MASEQRDLEVAIQLIDKDDEREFTLSDLADEYLADESPSSSSKEQSISLLPTISNQSEATTRTVGSSIYASSPETSTLTNTGLSFGSNLPAIKAPLESILFPDLLTSHDPTNSLDSIWKETSSLLGQILCSKTPEISTVATQQVPTCLFDRSLYERLTRLIALLPK